MAGAAWGPHVSGYKREGFPSIPRGEAWLHHRGGSWVGRSLKRRWSQIPREFEVSGHRSSRVRGFCIKRRALTLRRVRHREGFPSAPPVEVRTSTRGFSGGRLKPHPTPQREVDAGSSFSSGGLKTMLAWPPTTQRARGCRGFDGFCRQLAGTSEKGPARFPLRRGEELTGVCVDGALPE